MTIWHLASIDFFLRHIPSFQTLKVTKYSFSQTPSLCLEMNTDDTLSLESGASSTHENNDDHLATASSARDESASTSDKSAAGTAPSVVGGRETRLVRRSKAFLALVLVLAATGGAVATYRFLQQEDELAMSKEFELEATEVLTVSTLNALHIFDLFKAESLQMTTHAISSGQEWPFVTHPFFEVEGELLINQTKAGQYIALHPLVLRSQEEKWSSYTTENLAWLRESYEYHGVEARGALGICPNISKAFGDCVPDTKPFVIMAPIWQIAPVPGPNEKLINFNAFNSEFFSRMFEIMSTSGQAVLSEVINLQSDDFAGEAWSASSSTIPESMLCTPVRKTTQRKSPIVAVLTAVIPWNDYFINVLPKGAGGILVVVNSLVQSFTFRIDGPEVFFLGEGDLHDENYDYLEISNDFAAFDQSQGNFNYTVHLYPTDDFYEKHTTNRPMVYTIAVLCVFIFTASAFVLYDILVEKRQERVLDTATKSSAIVNSLFPENVRDRLMAEAGHDKRNVIKKDVFNTSEGNDLLTDLSGPAYTKPIADLFPEVTVMFADISGFTAWSSTREPCQVFLLLESIYNSFDKIARKMSVFKVETIGDTYVAVAGLPNPIDDHAEVMARFAYKCLVKMNSLVHNLELSLGPGTSDLCMRFGLHSGPVTAGVLRGEKSRFQLFGDTVNTAARMESTGMRNRIQISKQTRDLLVRAGKETWTKARDNKVVAKGKGELQTYWIVLGSQSGSTGSSSSKVENGGSREEKQTMFLKHATESALKSSTSMPVSFDKHDPARQRLILWNAENLLVLVQKIYLSRSKGDMVDKTSWRKICLDIESGTTPINEATETIDFPTQPVVVGDNREKNAISDVVVKQLVHLVSRISSMYNDNNFHNFAHASHVTQSVSKLLSRLAAFDDGMDHHGKDSAMNHGCHGFASRIVSDPLGHFAIVFSALVHDVDHPGVPNSTLIREGNEMATIYKNQSCAEQHAIDLAWTIFMEPTYEDLRFCLYRTKEELAHFRQVMINSVIATDLFDTERCSMRRQRWEWSFGADNPNVKPPRAEHSLQNDLMNQKATLVLEHMIQASDVSHTMQHWHIYISWNEKLFHEMYAAFKKGRSGDDPSHGWYQGELKFFDNYIIPLAQKLKDCKVFGVSGDEYMTYALQNREEWATKGKQIVGEYLGRTSDEFR